MPLGFVVFDTSLADLVPERAFRTDELTPNHMFRFGVGLCEWSPFDAEFSCTDNGAMSNRTARAGGRGADISPCSMLCWHGKLLQRCSRHADPDRQITSQSHNSPFTLKRSSRSKARSSVSIASTPSGVPTVQSFAP